ncbi:hypothetical protein NX059_003762 [Plenodomus lindquistii]|nr:hypothetical protein NX059_003762 [Plenodomus lindquistii]
MPALIVVAYPRTDKSTFNLDYYLNSHMPLCEKVCKPMGLKSWKVIKLSDDGPYTHASTIEFENVEAMTKALEHPETKAIQGDIPNFSNELPVTLYGDVVKQG